MNLVQPYSTSPTTLSFAFSYVVPLRSKFTDVFDLRPSTAFFANICLFLKPMIILLNYSINFVGIHNELPLLCCTNHCTVPENTPTPNSQSYSRYESILNHFTVPENTGSGWPPSEVNNGMYPSISRIHAL